MSRKSRNPSWGFIEISLLITILSALALSAVKVIFVTASDKVLADSSQRFIHSVAIAKKLAVQTHQKITIMANGGDWRNGWSLVDESHKTVKVENFAKEIQHISSKNHRIIFLPNGMTSEVSPLGENGLTFCNGLGQGRNLRMIATGFVTVKNIGKECLA